MNLNEYKLNFTYKYKNNSYTIHKDDERVKFAHEISDKGIKFSFISSVKIEVVSAELVYQHYFDIESKFFANGYQSWTKSREYGVNDKQNGLMGLAKLKIFSKYVASTGDYNFTKYRDKLFHSFTYTYYRLYDDLVLYGSLNEKSGYTIFYADVQNNEFIISKDLEGLITEGEYEFINIVKIEGTYDEVFDKYFANFKKRGKDLYLAGYTSWYNYYQKINDEIINRDLDGLITSNAGASIFQIDDGYETAVGDWDIDKTKFPKGLKPIVDKAHKNGLFAGLWIAPFAAEIKSKFFKEKKSLLLRDKNGHLVYGGVAWGGFYVLDLEKKECRDYIKKYFDKVFDEYGFDMVKLDFLYAQAIIPRNGKTRGQIMCEAMEFLAEICRDKIILGCGAPLGPSFGYVNAMRTGSDVDKTFVERFYNKTTNQEVISTKTSINNSIFRRHLNNRIFALDPDVFYLRDCGATKLKFSNNQKELLAKINNMCGSVLFVSDNINDYDDEKKEKLKKYFKKFDGKILNAEYVYEDEISIIYKSDDKTKRIKFIISDGSFIERELR